MTTERGVTVKGPFTASDVRVWGWQTAAVGLVMTFAVVLAMVAPPRGAAPVEGVRATAVPSAQWLGVGDVRSVDPDARCVCESPSGAACRTEQVGAVLSVRTTDGLPARYVCF